MLRNKAEKDNAEERAEALKKRGTKKESPTISLGLNRNVDVFRRYWFGYHYANYLKDDKKDSNKNNEETVSIIKRKGDKGKTKSKARRNTARVNSLLNKFRFGLLRKTLQVKAKVRILPFPRKKHKSTVTLTYL